MRIAADGIPQFDDDFRLPAGSPAAQRGVTLSNPDIAIDDPLAPPVAPDIGCYQTGQPGLDVGIDDRRRFPESTSNS
jgi:hypothetical protein